jgi:hypothetical protein
MPTLVTLLLYRPTCGLYLIGSRPVEEHREGSGDAKESRQLKAANIGGEGFLEAPVKAS